MQWLLLLCLNETGSDQICTCCWPLLRSKICSQEPPPHKRICNYIRHQYLYMLNLTELHLPQKCAWPQYILFTDGKYKV
jgi:hypothetical protein